MAKIVLIEDDAILQRMYQEKLEQEGHTVLTADNGRAGFDITINEQPDIVLCDIMMPATTGLEFLQLKREAAETHSAVVGIPVIMLTNLENDEFVTKAMELGAVDYLVKSKSDPVEVVAKVHKHLPPTQEVDTPAAA